MADLSDKSNLCVNKDCQVLSCCIDSYVQLTNIKEHVVWETENMISKCQDVMLSYHFLSIAFIPPLKILFPTQWGRLSVSLFPVSRINCPLPALIRYTSKIKSTSRNLHVGHIYPLFRKKLISWGTLLLCKLDFLLVILFQMKKMLTLARKLLPTVPILIS